MKEEQQEALEYIQSFAIDQLNNYILPFWRKKAVDHEMDGFFGRIENDLTINKYAEKGLILNARILWTFSAMYRNRGHVDDLELAQRAYTYICENFFDEKYGGYFWSLNYDGSPNDTKKQIYAEAFVIYALSEYFKVIQDQSILQRAVDLFHLIEKYAFDELKNGYIEARSREWTEMYDIRLSAKDMNEKKSMNTHLHVLEAYANLYRIWKDDQLKQKLENLIEIFTDIIIDKNDYHQILFFDDDWNPKSTLISYGHDIETSWLLHEAALILDNQNRIARITELSIKMTKAVMKGLSKKGALYYESDRLEKHAEYEIEWWAQAEALVGFLNAYLLTNDAAFLDIALRLAKFIDEFIVDKKYGEWFFRVTEDGKPILTHEKAGFWKCPYHNSRACLEILNRVDKLSQ